MGSFICSVLWGELHSGETPEMQSEEFERLAYENFMKYGGDDYKTHAKAEAIADYSVCEDYEKDKAVFAEIYQLL